MGVSKNRGTPKWMVYNGKPYSNGWFGDTIIFGNTQVMFEHWLLNKLVGKKSHARDVVCAFVGSSNPYMWCSAWRRRVLLFCLFWGLRALERNFYLSKKSQNDGSTKFKGWERKARLTTKKRWGNFITDLWNSLHLYLLREDWLPWSLQAETFSQTFPTRWVGELDYRERPVISKTLGLFVFLWGDLESPAVSARPLISINKKKHLKPGIQACLKRWYGILCFPGNHIHLHSSTISQHRCEGIFLRLHYTEKDHWFVWSSIIVREFPVTLVSTSMMIRIEHRIPFW